MVKQDVFLADKNESFGFPFSSKLGGEMMKEQRGIWLYFVYLWLSNFMRI